MGYKSPEAGGGGLTEPVEVEGTVTANQGAAGASPWPVDVSDEPAREVGVTRAPADTTATGSLTAAAQTVVLTPIPGEAVISVQITGTWTGQIEFEVTVDGTTWVARALHNGVDAVNATAGNGVFRLGMGAIAQFRCRASVLSSGQADVTIRSSRGALSSLTQALPTGANVIGQVTDGGSGKTLKRAVVALAATGDVIAAVATKRLKVYQYALQSRNDSMTCQFRDGGAGSLLTLRWGFNSREGAVASAGSPPSFMLATSAGNALQAVITGTGTVDIEVSYWDDDGS